MNRRLSVGAECADNGVDFRVWALGRGEVALLLEHEAQPRPLQPLAAGYFSLHVPEARAGMRYRYRIDDREPCPDIASRYQPEGPSGPSEVIDASCFRWNDAAWPGLSLRQQVLYELHIGTFT